MTVNTSVTECSTKLQGAAMVPYAADQSPQYREWAPLHHLMLQVPAKYQNLLLTDELRVTAIAAVPEYILLGTNTGSLYWYDCVTCKMQRFRTEGEVSCVTRVSAVTSSDHLLAAGHVNGDVTIFLVPRLARGQVPEFVRLAEANLKKSLRFSVSGQHRSAVSALCWSRNASKLYSGDVHGAVVLTDIDYVQDCTRSQLLMREPSGVVQLNYRQQLLLVATRQRCCLFDTLTGQVVQVGAKPRKTAADLGGCLVSACDADSIISARTTSHSMTSSTAGVRVIAARASLRLVTADLSGKVLTTIALKPGLSMAEGVPVLNPGPVPSQPTSAPAVGDVGVLPTESVGGGCDDSLRRLIPLSDRLLAAHTQTRLYIIDRKQWCVVSYCDQLPAVLDMAVTDAGDIYVLCSSRRVVRLSTAPDTCHPTVCDQMRLSTSELDLGDLMDDLKSSRPVTQVRSLISSVTEQLGRSTVLLEAFTDKADVVSSWTGRVGSLMSQRLGAVSTVSTADRTPPLSCSPLKRSSIAVATSSSSAAAGWSGAAAPLSPHHQWASSPDVTQQHERPAVAPQQQETAETAPAFIARRIRPRRRHKRHLFQQAPGSTSIVGAVDGSFDSMSLCSGLSGESAVIGATMEAEVETESRVVSQSMSFLQPSGSTTGVESLSSLQPSGTISGVESLSSLQPSGTISGVKSLSSLQPSGTIPGVKSLSSLQPSGTISGVESVADSDGRLVVGAEVVSSIPEAPTSTLPPTTSVLDRVEVSNLSSSLSPTFSRSNMTPSVNVPVNIQSASLPASISAPASTSSSARGDSLSAGFIERPSAVDSASTPLSPAESPLPSPTKNEAGEMDFRRFYPRELRHQLSDSELERQMLWKEERLASALGLDAVSSTSSGSPVVPKREESRTAAVVEICRPEQSQGYQVLSSSETVTSSSEADPNSEIIKTCIEDYSATGAPKTDVSAVGGDERRWTGVVTSACRRGSCSSGDAGDSGSSSSSALPRPEDLSTTESYSSLFGDWQRSARTADHAELDTTGSPAVATCFPPLPEAPASSRLARDAETGESEVPLPQTELQKQRRPPDADGDRCWVPWSEESLPAPLAALSACDRYAVAVDTSGRLMSSQLLEPPGDDCWRPLAFPPADTAPVRQVALSTDGRRLWRLDADGVAYALVEPAVGAPVSGSHWVRAARDVAQLTVDDASVWYLKRSGRLCVQRDLARHRVASPEVCVDTPAAIIHVVARQGVVWVCTEAGDVLCRVGVSRAELAGFGWTAVDCGGLVVRGVYLGAGETGWVVDSQRRLHVTGGVSATLPRGIDGVWRRVLGTRMGSAGGHQMPLMAAGPELRPSLCVEGNTAWYAEPGVSKIITNRLSITAIRWQLFRPRGVGWRVRDPVWRQVVAEGVFQRRGQLWAINSRGHLYGGAVRHAQLKSVSLPDKWSQIQCLAAAPGTLWVLTSSGDIFVREGLEQTACGTGWHKLDLTQIESTRLVHVSLGSSSVWACDGRGSALIRMGPTVARASASHPLHPAWVALDTPKSVIFKKVYVGPGDGPVWTVDSDQRLWRRVGITSTMLAGCDWQLVTSSPCSGVFRCDQLALAAADGAVWTRALGTGSVHRWMPAVQNWCRVPGATKHISASVDGELWVVHEGGIYTLDELCLQPGVARVPHMESPTAVTVSSDESDEWTVVTCR